MATIKRRSRLVRSGNLYFTLVVPRCHRSPLVGDHSDDGLRQAARQLVGRAIVG